MKCPYCGYLEDRVLDTRIGKDGESNRRRRECLKCHGRFTTIETLLQVYPLIIKKDGRREPFSKEKVLKGIQAACQKRPVSLSQMDQIVDRVAKWVLSRPEREVTSTAVGQKVVKELRLLDDVAYVRFASVYQTFQDVDEFVEHLESDDEEQPRVSLTPDNEPVTVVAAAAPVAREEKQLPEETSRETVADVPATERKRANEQTKRIGKRN